jgi:hypothetical protein
VVLASAGGVYGLYQAVKNRTLATNVHLPAAFIGSVFGTGLAVVTTSHE